MDEAQVFEDEYERGRDEGLIVGKYTITHDRDGDYWIEHESGEGMQVFKVNFETLIDEFYKLNY